MRGLIVLLLVIAGALGAAWIGGETWLAHEAARRIADDPRIAAAAVTPLRDRRRIGLHLTDVTVATPDGEAVLPALDLWAAPTAPTQVHAGLPAQMTLPIGGALRRVGAEGAALSLRVSPASRMAINHAAAVSGPVSLDGVTVAQDVDVEATLTALGGAAPKGARASYLVRGHAEGLALAAALPQAADAGPLSAEGAAQVFLTDPVVPGNGAPPQVVGFASDGVTLRLGERAARATARLAADADGRASGAVFLYTRDASAWLTLAAEAGVLPKGMVALAGTALSAAAAAAPDLPAGMDAPADPQPGELRIPLLFKDGHAFLGPLPIGPAPAFPR